MANTTASRALTLSPEQGLSRYLSEIRKFPMLAKDEEFMLAKRWQDPAFPRAFPWFADNKYWEGQVLAFKEQLAALNEPPLQLMPQW